MDPWKLTVNDTPIVNNIDVKNRKNSAELRDDCDKILAWYEAAPRTLDSIAFQQNQMVEWLLLESPDQEIFRDRLIPDMKRFFW